MELGALVCLPENPQCLLCPLFSHCAAAQKGVQGELPETEKSKINVELQMAVILAERGGRYLVRKRGDDEKWLRGLWEFPSAEGENFEKALSKLEKSWGAQAERKALLEVKHQITHHKIRLRLYRAKSTDRKTPKDGQWATLSQLETFPFSSAQVKLRGWVRKHSSK